MVLKQAINAIMVGTLARLVTMALLHIVLQVEPRVDRVRAFKHRALVAIQAPGVVTHPVVTPVLVAKVLVSGFPR